MSSGFPGAVRIRPGSLSGSHTGSPHRRAPSHGGAKIGVADGPEEERAGRPRESLSSRNATVLLVEDETPLRKLLLQVLSGVGHRVLEAANGEEALALSSRHSRPIDLLLTDVVMPGIDRKS